MGEREEGRELETERGRDREREREGPNVASTVAQLILPTALCSFASRRPNAHPP